MKDYTKTIELLKKKAVTDNEAVEILNRALTINPSNQKTFWKMTRLTFYVWERFAEYKKGNLGRKTDTIRKVVNLKEYKNIFSFPIDPLSTTTLYDKKFFSPVNPEIYLKKKYGKKWAIPDKKQFFWINKKNLENKSF